MAIISTLHVSSRPLPHVLFLSVNFFSTSSQFSWHSLFICFLCLHTWMLKWNWTKWNWKEEWCDERRVTVSFSYSHSRLYSFQFVANLSRIIASSFEKHWTWKVQRESLTQQLVHDTTLHTCHFVISLTTSKPRICI